MTSSDHSGLSGSSPRVRELRRVVSQIATADLPVLIVGESGSGKEAVARAIHAQSARKDAPFVGRFCLAIPASLIESELFGHKRGAFTDARERLIGLFEHAQGRSSFLDEIGDVRVSVQKRPMRGFAKGAHVGGAVIMPRRLTSATSRLRAFAT
jgi:two-component system nitrogen regulation response regulator GlnG